MRLALASPCAAGKIDQLRQYGASLEKELARSEATLSQAERELGVALQKMLTARQHRQSIETFREHQRAEYDRDVLREEQKFLDDLARRPVAAGVDD
jgi:flagellar export protein FliJ